MTLTKLLRAARPRPDTLLPAGVLLGLVLAALGAFAPHRHTPPGDAAAWVNGVPIARADHERVTEALAASKRNPLDTEDRKYALSRLIDEELLLQRSIELGLHRSDAVARKRLVAAMLEWIAADAANTAPQDAELRKFYRDNRALFIPPARIEVDWLHIARSEPDGETRAKRVAQRLGAGESFAEITSAASPSAMRLPSGLLPPAKLQDYLGPSLTQAALTLKPGRPAGPFAQPDGWDFLLVRRREEAMAPAFETVREEVKAEFLRRRDDEAVRHYLGWLRRRAAVVIAPDGKR